MASSKAEYSKVSIHDTNDQPSHPPPATLVASTHVNLSPTTRAALPIACYCFASILMTVTNKYVLSGYGFNMNFLLLTIQFREFDKEEARKWMPIAAALVAMIYTGSKSLQYLPIAIYTVFKNLTIILIAYGEVLWFGSIVTEKMLLAFGLMVLSSIIAGWADISSALQDLMGLDSTLIGYFWMATNCLSSAAFVLYMRKRIKLTNFKDFDTVYYNNLLSIPLLIIPSFIFEDWSSENLAKTFPEEIRSQMIYAMVFSGVSAFVMSYASAWCVRTTSSTTYSMVGALNKLPIAASGILFFGDPATFANVTAIIVGFIAGLVYSYAKTFGGKPSNTNLTQSIPMSASSQSAADAAKANGKL
ncbi:UDP-galactose transporter [Hesseltinella vesiculosa]|uniref:GDP-mannose transporter n=1 Tax=Hesseltinella vesiculosa TaxID=101127 RepID=A0A1X2GAR2_9FUNG|nr:UDP-galactose transporter [Hesseltinella vesiculosa]